ncbi:hypothetical protein [Halotalea alkalilenta]|uniref:hypothetical protein n=1 Tax=Halotalea alkalilenta TaxID=376489 RepID=UPI0012371735|nr:hypothetical protein [Halotalea alkalilenta]
MRSTFVPSRLALAAHLGIASLIALALWFWLDWRLGLLAWSGLCWLGWYETRRVPPALRWSTLRSCWQDEREREVDIVAFRLAPLVIGLKIDGRVFWLWPDSADGETLWRLRRRLRQRSEH